MPDEEGPPGTAWQRAMANFQKPLLDAIRWANGPLWASQRSKRGGGRPLGAVKGEVWPRQRYIDWYREASQDYASGGNRRVKLRELGEAMGVTDDTARARLRDLDPPLPWPPESHLEEWDPDPESGDLDAR